MTSHDRTTCGLVTKSVDGTKPISERPALRDMAPSIPMSDLDDDYDDFYDNGLDDPPEYDRD